MAHVLSRREAPTLPAGLSQWFPGDENARRAVIFRSRQPFSEKLLKPACSGSPDPNPSPKREISVIPLRAAALALLLPAAAHAQDRSGVSLTVGLSTMGALVEPGYRVNDHFGIRAPIGYASGDVDYDTDETSYTADAKIGGLGLVGDLYPWGGAVRISAGVVQATYEADLLSSDYEFNGMTGRLQADVSQSRDIAPIAGIGVDLPVFRRGLVRLDAGAIFTGGFDVRAAETSGRVPQELVDAEIADIREDIDGIDAVPFLRISIGFRF